MNSSKLDANQTDSSPEDRLRAFRELTITARIAWSKWFNDKLPRHLGRVQTPSLILWGTHEKLFPVALAQKYADALPHATLQLFDDCGHMVPFENPTEFAKAIVEFVERTGAK